MDDRTTILVANEPIFGIVRYSIRQNIYQAAGTFEIELDPQSADSVHEGDRVDIKVAGTTAMIGIVERIEEQGNKSSATLRISGRDLMGLVVDEYLQSFKTLSNKTLMSVAEYYLGQIDRIKYLPRSYINGADRFDIPLEWVQPQPGQTVFDLLSGIAAARGIHFYMRPEGRIVFGKPFGYGSHQYSIWRTVDGNSNVLDWSRIRDISQRYSRVIVLGQQQSTFDTPVAAINQKATVVDDTFPPGLSKTMVIETDTAAQSLSRQGQMIVEQQRLDGYSIRYVVPGHAQRGYAWAPDTICSVDDYRLQERGRYLVYERAFVFDKQTKKTELVLGRMAA